jgi:hypothetical protein
MKDEMGDSHLNESHFSHLSTRRSPRSLLATLPACPRCRNNPRASTQSMPAQEHQPAQTSEATSKGTRVFWPAPNFSCRTQVRKRLDHDLFQPPTDPKLQTHAASIRVRQAFRVALRWLVGRGFRVLGTLRPYLNHWPRTWESRRTVGLGKISRCKQYHGS